MRGLDDDELLTMVTVRQSEFLPEAIEVAREECFRRGITASTIESLNRRMTRAIREASGFCEECWNATTNEPLGSTLTLNFFYGTRLRDEGEQCPRCGSVRVSAWFWFLFPVLKLGTYRVLYESRSARSGSWVGRRLKEGQQGAEAAGSPPKGANLDNG
jgi:hypothetical protein